MGKTLLLQFLTDQGSGMHVTILYFSKLFDKVFHYILVHELVK